ncbi:hypothetical protein, partial [Saccharibacillus endophyticus]|uniref:hypothetical protein n=1 Tax=Saccharibacillus endophyticus TaxID=2060666 RepID=UPI001C130966
LTMIFIIATHLLFSFQGANRVDLFLSFNAVCLSGDFYILSQSQAVRQALFLNSFSVLMLLFEFVRPSFGRAVY